MKVVFVRWVLSILAIAASGCGVGSLQDARSSVGSTVLVEVERGAISIAGESVSDDAALQAALKRFTRDRPTLVVKASSRADEPYVRRVLAATMSLELRGIDLRVADLRVRLLGNYDIPASPSVAIVAQFTADEARLWSLHMADGSVSSLGAIKVGDESSEGATASRLEHACRNNDCTAYLTLGSDTPLIETLMAWQRVAVEIPMRVAVPSDSPSSAPGSGPAEEQVSGRIPPEAIQTIVRAKFWLFRTCYWQGLRRNSSLSGNVTARFVIGRDGKVMVAKDQGSTIPDAEVRDCVINAFRTMTFPPPEGGIVTVIYPINLEPG